MSRQHKREKVKKEKYMPGPPFALPNTFQIVGHFVGADPSETWRSEFALQGAVGVVPQPGDPIVTDIETYFLENLRTDCKLDSLVLREWSFGPQPLAARGSIWIKPLSLPGLKTVSYTGQQASPALTGKEVVAFIKVLTSPGKPGKQFLRQLYDLGDVGAIAGAPWETLPTARVTPTAFHVTVTGNLAAHLGTGAAQPNIVVVHFSRKQYNAAPGPATMPFVTPALDLQLIGPTTNRPTRKNKR